MFTFSLVSKTVISIVELDPEVPQPEVLTSEELKDSSFTLGEYLGAILFTGVFTVVLWFLLQDIRSSFLH